MDATCFVRSGLDAEGRRNYVEVPDHAIRLMAAVRVLEFRRGKPVSSAIVAHLTPGAPPDVRRADALRDLCTRNPELIENIIRNLAQTQKPVIEAETCARVEMDPQKSPTG